MFDQHQTFYVILDRAFNQFLIIISILMCVCVWGGVGVCVVCVCVYRGGWCVCGGGVRVRVCNLGLTVYFAQILSCIRVIQNL